MKILTLVVGNVVAWCMLCQPVMSQQDGAAGTSSVASSAGTARSPGGASTLAPAGAATSSSTASTQSSPNPLSGGGLGTSNPSASAPNTLGPQTNAPAESMRLSGAQPGQTGTMESQRRNAFNEAYQPRSNGISPDGAATRDNPRRRLADAPSLRLLSDLDAKTSG